MIHCAWPWAYSLLLLPLLVRWFLPSVKDHASAALWVPFINQLTTRFGTSGGARWTTYFALAIWVLLLVALSRPQWLSDPVDKPKSGRDMMIAVDLSASMETQDFVLNEMAVDRLTAVKAVVTEFIKQRKGDRVGLILFGSKAYVQSPLSYDLNSVAQLLQEADTRMVGKMTAIGDAIGLAVKRLHARPGNQRVLILLSDGNNTAGILPATRAAHFAALEGLTVYTVGIGSENKASVLGNNKISRAVILNETTLKAVAKATGGRYFRTKNLAQLQSVYDAIDEREKVVSGAEYFHHILELYHWPLGAALILSFLFALLKSQIPFRGKL
ncbi:MAG: VWA domain-containing protein [Pseudomonadales bacterium]|nr:VWA domain-containing protein [Pseudomonadales bacterium]